MKRLRTGRALGLALLLLAGCGAQDVILPGERLDIRARPDQTGVANLSQPIRLSAQVNQDAWTHRAGSASHTIQHPALSATPVQIWASKIGEAADRRHRITADPVATGGRVFTLDSRATVAATSTAGAPLWARDLTPAGENPNDASGGGLATAGDRVFVTTGFGELVALETGSGAELWRQKLEAPATGAPTIFGGLVYVVTRDSRAWAIEADTGRIRWQLAGTPSGSGIVGGAGPAVNARLAVFPFGSAELVATLPKGGLRLWQGSVSGARLGRAYANITDVTGDPVIRGQVIYAGNPSGRTVALDSVSGERLWTAQDGATGPVWVDGGSVFLVSDQAEIVRLNATTGARIWAVTLPNVVPVRRQARARDVYTHFGPVLAGGRLWVGSGDGQLRGFDPVDGSLVATVPLPGGAATRPIVVAGSLYIVSQDGELLAFR